MAYPTKKTKRLAELVKQGDSSRLILSGAHARLRYRLDMPSRIKSSIIGAPAKWLGGSLVAGFATSLLFRSGKKKAPAQIAAKAKERGIFLALLALAFKLGKPAAKIYATKLLKDSLSRRFLDGPDVRPVAMRKPPY